MKAYQHMNSIINLSSLFRARWLVLRRFMMKDEVDKCYQDSGLT